MNIKISDEAAAWYKEELDLTPVPIYVFSCVMAGKASKKDFL